MPIIDTILSTPVNIATLGAGAPIERKLDAAFSNLLYYAKSNWSYTASSQTGGDALLAGTASSAPCGGIATALKKVFMDGLGVAEKDIEYIRVTGYLWTGPQYLCFDPKVRGNLRRLEVPNGYTNGCIFNEHYYLKCHGKFYDPCLSQAYAMKDQSIKERFNGTRMPLEVGSRRKFMWTADAKTCILYMPEETVPGFNGAYVMFDATKKNVEKAMGTRLFKDEMARQSGNSSFAKFVNTLR